MFEAKRNATPNQQFIVKDIGENMVNIIDVKEVICPLCRVSIDKSKMKHWLDYTNRRDGTCLPKGRTSAERDLSRNINKKRIERKRRKEARDSAQRLQN